MTGLSPGGQTKGGGSQHWCTPLWIVEMVHEVFRAAPDLDPFSNPQSETGALTHWYGPDAPDPEFRHDGFALSWMEAAAEDPCDPWNVFFNNPWNRTGDAVRKAASEWDRWGRAIQIISLFPCSMNAKHWPLVEAAPARCYFDRRPSFVVDGKIKKGNPKDVAVAYWGDQPYWFAHVFAKAGRIHFGQVAA